MKSFDHKKCNWSKGRSGRGNIENGMILMLEWGKKTFIFKEDNILNFKKKKFFILEILLA